MRAKQNAATVSPALWRALLVSAALLGGLGVLLGAFGAHGLEGVLTLEGMEVYRTAVDYHFTHVLGMLLTLALAGQAVAHYYAIIAASLHAAGIILFSGSLYVLALTQHDWLGMITPIGGMGFFAGWLTLAFGIARYR